MHEEEGRMASDRGSIARTGGRQEHDKKEGGKEERDAGIKKRRRAGTGKTTLENFEPAKTF